jgi:hypothetical protein
VINAVPLKRRQIQCELYQYFITPWFLVIFLVVAVDSHFYRQHQLMHSKVSYEKKNVTMFTTMKWKPAKMKCQTMREEDITNKIKRRRRRRRANQQNKMFRFHFFYFSSLTFRQYEEKEKKN